MSCLFYFVKADIRSIAEELLNSVLQLVANLISLRHIVKQAVAKVFLLQFFQSTVCFKLFPCLIVSICKFLVVNV